MNYIDAITYFASGVPVLLITLSADVAQSLVSLMSLVTSDTTDKKFDHLLIVDGEEKPRELGMFNVIHFSGKKKFFFQE